MHNRRRNKETMYHITTKKASGVISGVQTSENGPIQWNRELPNTCLLSAGIKKHVTPLLAGYVVQCSGILLRPNCRVDPSR